MRRHWPTSREGQADESHNPDIDEAVEHLRAGRIDEANALVNHTDGSTT